ncbi:MAG: riboflavin synthase [Candidatus Competibacterales bacterium]
MFTGIIQALGHLAERRTFGGDQRLLIHTDTLDLRGIAKGDSVAVNGVCLTAVDLTPQGFWADVSAETLGCTTLGALATGERLNLELSLLPTTRLGGHLVSGHVDGIGRVEALAEDARSWRFRLAAPPPLGRYIAPKGSICVDGVSLTVNAVAGSAFEVNIVPHTYQVTRFGHYTIGTAVNLEVDLVARYLERLLGRDEAADPPTPPPGTSHD